MSDFAVFSEVSNRKVREAMAVPFKILLQGYCIVIKNLYSLSLTVFFIFVGILSLPLTKKLETKKWDLLISKLNSFFTLVLIHFQRNILSFIMHFDCACGL